MGCSTVFVCARGVYTRSETNKLYRDIIEIKEIERGTPVSICYMWQSLCVAESIDMTTGFSMNRHRQQQRRNKKAKRRKERSISAAFWVTWPMHGAPALPAGFFSVDALYSFLVFPFIYFFFFPAHHRVQAMSRAFIYLSIYAEEDAAAAALRSTMSSLWPTSRSGNQQFSV